MSFVVAILGRPNVGKSSLFNRLVGGRRALVAEEAGLTRDLRFGLLTPERRRKNERQRAGGDPLADLQPAGSAPADPEMTPEAAPEVVPEVVLVDTGGLESDSSNSMAAAAADLAWSQAQRADLVLLVTDASVGPTGFDEELVARLRRGGNALLLIANKADRSTPIRILSDHSALGVGEPLAVSARTGRGLAQLRRQLRTLAAAPTAGDSAAPHEDDGQRGNIVLVGRPNAGKSTLMNRLCGDYRSIVSEEPGTTRDEVRADFVLDGERYSLIDTAGVHRKWRAASAGQALAAARALSSVQRSMLAILLVDAGAGLTEQDQRLLGHALEDGKGVLLAFNKADAVDAEDRRQLLQQQDRRMAWASFVPHCFISARTGDGVKRMLALVRKLIEDSDRNTSTGQINRILQELLSQHPPPTKRGRWGKLRYAHPVADTPLKIRVYGTACEQIPDSYRRYLEKGFGKELGGMGRPVQVELQSVNNPYAGRAKRR